MSSSRQSVVVSPTDSLPAAMSRKRRRMILPLRVFGSAAVKRILSGVAKAPICLRTWAVSSDISDSLPSPCFSVTKQQMPSPLISCGKPTAAASATR